MTQIHGFELLREQTIAELNTHARLFRHVKTGAELLSLSNDDENKSFGVTFRTPLADSTGVAHILEHSVLCGSRKYPVKEPFVELVKGSLKTFINAFTYSDKTVYPVASTNLQDFYNLIDVYLDSVFYPHITPQVLQQEGWHYHLEHADAELIYKGVVYNEMKGVYSSPDSLVYRYTQQSLFPDTNYGFDSGGDPKHIPDLTYEQFKEFHSTFYHPSNARFYFYGDDPLDERLRLINSYLQDFERIPVNSAIPLQAGRGETTRKTYTYPVSTDTPGGPKAMITVNWLFDGAPDEQTTLGLNILEHILIGTAAAPLRKALIDSGLGEDLAGVGMVDSIRQFYFSVGLKGIAADNADTIENLIIQTLNDLATHGIAPDTVAASLNTVEFLLRENNTGSFPRGISLMLQSLKTWLYDGDPLAPLAFEAPLNAIKERIAQGERYFEELLQSFILGNPNRTTVLILPDPEQSQREAAAERAHLDAVRAALSDSEVQEIVALTNQLKQAQTTPDPPEALALIPSLTLADLEREIKTIPTEQQEHAGTTVLYHDLFTNGIVYLDLGLNLHMLPPRLLPYASLFGQALLEMGTETEDFVRLTQRIGRSTGGITSNTFTGMITGNRESAAWLFLRAKALAGQSADLLAILRDVLCTTRFDNQERFRQIVLKARAGKESSLVPNGHSFVANRLSAHFSQAGSAVEQMNGVSNLFFMRDLEQRIENDWPAVLADLEELRRLLLNRTTLICNVTVDAATWAGFAPQLQAFLAELPATTPAPIDWTFATERRHEGLIIPARVNFVGKGANLYQAGYTYHGSAAVITRYLSNSWLWNKVRVQGGAYGAFCYFDRISGLFGFGSYRDPNLHTTLETYDQAGTFLREAELSELELTRGIIGAISEMDNYQLPDAKGYTAMLRHLTGITDETRQRIRDEVLGMTVTDFRTFADALDQCVRDHGQIVVMGAAESITAANEANNHSFTTVKVL